VCAFFLLFFFYTPFTHTHTHTHTPLQILYEQIKAGDYEFPSPEWDSVTPDAKDLIRRLLTVDAHTRISVHEALQHPWIAKGESVPSRMNRQNTLEAMRR
jgi:serine/threonine protein kinase